MPKLDPRKGTRYPRPTPNAPRNTSAPRLQRGRPQRQQAARPRPQQSPIAQALSIPKPQAPLGTLANPHTDTMTGAPPSTGPLPAAINPYTGAPLGANEYVGIAGSEAENQGKVRIPPPGWWDPSNPNYERRNYYVSPDGKTIAREAGFDPSADDPWDTGRASEVNAEYERMAGGADMRMSEPGIQRWGPGKPKPALPAYGQTGGGGGGAGRMTYSARAGLAQALGNPLGDTASSDAYPQKNPDELLYALLNQIKGRVRGARGNTAYDVA